MSPINRGTNFDWQTPEQTEERDTLILFKISICLKAINDADNNIIEKPVDDDAILLFKIASEEAALG